MPVRLFRNAPIDGIPMQFYGMIHEHPERGLNKGPGPIIVLADAHIAHVGYLTESVRQKRFWRNYPLLQRDIEKYPERLLQKHFICRDNMLLAGYRLAQGAGQNDAEIVRLCNETVDLYRKYFLGKPGYVNVDSIQYYSQALQLLGIGVDVTFDIAAGRDGHGAKMNGSSLRFANQEDLMAEINWRAEQAVKPFLRTDF